jgi:zinc/manganese transport system permease protein
MQGYLDILGIPLLACLAMLGILSYVGIHVLMREVIFIDIALAQIVAVGATWAHVCFQAREDSFLYYALALGLAILTAAFYAMARRRISQIPIEAVIGVTYAIAAAGALFIVGKYSAGGHVHVQQMLSGSILWATWTDLWVSAAGFAVVGTTFFLLREPFTAVSENYEDALCSGMAVAWWDFLFYVLVSIVIAVAVRIGGVVLVFAFLIIPATTSACFACGWIPRLLIAWGTGALASVLGLLFVARLDFSVGPSVALFLGIGLALAALTRVCRARQALSVMALAATAYVGLLVFCPATSSGLESRAGRAAPLPDAGAFQAFLPPEGEPADRPPRASVERAEDMIALRSLFHDVTDTGLRVEIVRRALDMERRAGVSLAIEWLEENPPLFFRQQVLDDLNRIARGSMDYDVTKPFSDASNQAAIKRLKSLVCEPQPGGATRSSD